MSMGDAATMRDIAVTSFFRAAFEEDMYPAEGMERVFGVQMDHGVGSCVFNSWKTLFLRGRVTVANVKAAIAQGRLPRFFEAAVRSLSTRRGDEATHSYYTLRLMGEDVDMPGNWSLPPGSLFESIAWDRRVLAALADAPNTPEAGVRTSSRRPPEAQPRRLFNEGTVGSAGGVTVGTPVAEGVVLQAESSDGAPIAMGRPVEVLEGSPLSPEEERMLRGHLDRMFVGREFVLHHLTSARGQQLNGRRARVVGRDSAPGKYRLHVRVDGAAPFRVLSTNLALPGRRTRTPAPASEDAPAVLRALRGLLDAYPTGSSRTDVRSRLEYLRSHVDVGRVPPPTRCGDAIRPSSEHSSWVQTISHMRPCCHGDNVCDLRRFDLNNVASLKEWVVTGMCEACQAVIFAEPEAGDAMDVA